MNSRSPAVLSADYAHRERTARRIAGLGGAVALVCAVLGLWNERLVPATAPVDLVALATIAVCVVANRILGWHERAVGYRMLGEIERMSLCLSRLGWSLPSLRIGEPAYRSHRAWALWLAAAYARERPLPAATLTTDELARTRDEISDSLVAEQIRFHLARRTECERAARRLEWWGWLFFVLSVLLVLVQVGLGAAHQGREVMPYLALATTILPAAAAAAFGLRAYEKYERLAECSEHLAVALEAARKRISAIDLGRPLASQKLAAELFEVTSIMMADEAAWA